MAKAKKQDWAAKKARQLVNRLGLWDFSESRFTEKPIARALRAAYRKGYKAGMEMPEVRDWSKAEKGKFYRGAKHGR